MGAWILRILVLGGLLGSAWVHYELWAFEEFSEIDIIGPLFMVNVVAGVVIALAIVFWHHWLPVLAAIGFGAVTLGAYLISLTPSGLFGVQEQFQMPTEFWGLATEAGCVVFGIALLFVQSRTRQAALA